MREALVGLGFDMDRYHQESFHAPVGETEEFPEGVTLDDEVKAEIDKLKGDLSALREEHENLRAHLKGSIQEVARLTEENERLRR